VVLGVPTPYFCEHLDEDTAAALARARSALEAAGHDTVDVAVEHAAWTPDVYMHIALPEAARYHAPLLERHASKYSPGVRLRLEMGRYILAEDYVRAVHLKDVLRAAVDRALERCDVLLLPAQPTGAPRIGAASVEIAGRREPVRAAMLRLTQLFNLTGHPAVAMPAGRGKDGLPRSLQIVGRRDGTERLLAIAAAVERHISGGPGSVGGGTG
jgi:aspartyl-tRNA(Asn)/glutamyl-tRNA(Gln) amidotransferase subunit A